MARIQVLPLPAEQVGSFHRTPYILVIDSVGPGETDSLLASVAADPGLKERVGAAGVLVFEFPVDVA